MGKEFGEGLWNGNKCPVCGKDCWKNRMNLAIEIAKNFNGEFSMKELYEQLAKKHPPARKTEKRKTPWATFFRDLYENPNFVKVGRGLFKLVENPHIDNTIRRKKHDGLSQFEINVKKLQILKEANLITEGEYTKKGKELLDMIETGDGNIEKIWRHSSTQQIKETNINSSTTSKDYRINKDEAKQLQEQARDKFIAFLKYEQKLDITKIKGRGLYGLNGLKVNIKYDRKKNNENMFWFNASREYLFGIKKKKIDFFIFICDNPENFFVIPNSKMAELIKDASIDSSSGNPNFDIQIKKSECLFLPHDGKGTKLKISEYYKNLQPIK